MLKIEHLTKTYGGKPAVQHLSLHIAPGGVCAPSSATTAPARPPPLSLWLRHPAPSTPGEIFMRTASPCGRTRWPASGRLAYLPDDPAACTSYMTGIQYLELYRRHLRRKRRTAGAAHPAVRRCFSSLTQDLAQSIGAYSHGMKQKLAIICGAGCIEPKLILMDEPFVGSGSARLPINSRPMMKAFCDARRGDFLLHPCAGGGRKALRQGSYSA